LALLWEFLATRALDWRSFGVPELSELAGWLLRGWRGNVAALDSRSGRSERTVNRILSTVVSFYRFQEELGGCSTRGLTRERRVSFAKYKPFLAHAMKGRRVSTRKVLLKEQQRLPGYLTREQVSTLVAACETLLEKLLVCLLYETGLRIGEALGLFHEDMVTGGRNAIRVVPRDHGDARLRQKGQLERWVDVSLDLMRLYSRYLLEEYPEGCCSDYVFVQAGDIGLRPLSYSSAQSLFERLSRRTSLHVTPHMLRHTHATELIRAGWNVAHVQKRLGHASVQTTINTYSHVTDDDLRQALDTFISEQAGKTGGGEHGI
jgi:integrase